MSAAPREIALPDGISLLARDGAAPPALCLHGLGSTREDWAPVFQAPRAATRAFAAFDFPGSGRSPYRAEGALDVDHLVGLVERAVDRLDAPGVHLAGHSLGGLVALLAARRIGPAVRSLASIEGNLAPEDCDLFSRAASRYAREPFEDRFLPWLHVEMERSDVPGDAAFAEGFRRNVTPRAFLDYARSIVDVCDTRPLLDMFLSLPMPRLYVRGERSRTPSYLPRLLASGVEVVTVPASGHFPLYANARFVAEAYARFLDRAEAVPARATRSGSTT